MPQEKLDQGMMDATICISHTTARDLCLGLASCRILDSLECFSVNPGIASITLFAQTFNVAIPRIYLSHLFLCMEVKSFPTQDVKPIGLMLDGCDGSVCDVDFPIRLIAESFHDSGTV